MAVSTSMASVLLTTDLARRSVQVTAAPRVRAPRLLLMPTTNAATVIPDGAVVVYGADSNIATNYDPGWGQSGNGQVDLYVDPGTGDLVLAYPNFNYQGTEIQTTDLSDMTHLHVDIWVAVEQLEWSYFPQSITGRGPRNPWSKYQSHRAHGIVLTCLNLPLQG